jgi:glycerol-3-phosphate dehydrogenase
LFLHATAALEMAPKVASLLARELGRDQAWEQAQIKEFTTLASQYVLSPHKQQPMEEERQNNAYLFNSI